MAAEVIAISNQKGGVAKTTTTYSLGACLAESGYRTLVVDLDSQANLTLAAGLDPHGLQHTIVDLFDGKQNGAYRKKTLLPDLHILPADLRLSRVERSLYEKGSYEETLVRMLQPWMDDYHFILLDCPPSFGAMTIIGLIAADRVLIPVQSEYYAVQGLARLLKIAEFIKSRTGKDVSYHVLVTMLDTRNRIHRVVLEKLQGNFPDLLLDTRINIDTNLRECSATGEPIILYDPDTRASREYRALAQELIQEVMP
jgi:chromosome partitioning protein